ncbi:uncharacterized protein TNCV_4792961 [Trichonephila clavipes]|nr:uncharacterized protein TNCV_4792961 [Trichonephila clavipes]
MFTNDHEEYRNLIHFWESDKDFEFYIIKRNIDKPIKAVIKGLPSSSKIEDITKDLADEGFVIDSCMQLISKRTKKELPYFLVILPRNDKNSKIFDLAHLSCLQTEGVKACQLAASLRGEAAEVLQDLPDTERLNLNSLCSVLDLRFGQKYSKDYARLQMKTRLQKTSESLQEYTSKTERLANLAFSD